MKANNMDTSVKKLEPQTIKSIAFMDADKIPHSEICKKLNISQLQLDSVLFQWHIKPSLAKQSEESLGSKLAKSMGINL